jgi:hypothetical protein
MPTLLLLANPEAQPGRERLRHLEAHYKISHTHIPPFEVSHQELRRHTFSGDEMEGMV